MPGLAQLCLTLIKYFRFSWASPPLKHSKETNYEEECLKFPPSFIASRRGNVPLRASILSLGGTDENSRWLLLAGVDFPGFMWAGDRREDVRGEGREREARKEVEAVQGWLLGRHPESLRSSRTISREETHNCASPSTYLSVGWYEAIPREKNEH